MNKLTAYNSSYKKLAVQWLNEALGIVASSVLADSFELRNRQLLVAAKHYTILKTSTSKKRINRNFKQHI